MPLLLHGIMAPDGGPRALRLFHPASSLAMLRVKHRREHDKSRLFFAVELEPAGEACFSASFVSLPGGGLIPGEKSAKRLPRRRRLRRIAALPAIKANNLLCMN